VPGGPDSFLLILIGINVMKKLFLFLVAGFVFSAGAFAHVTIGGTLGFRADIINNSGSGEGAHGLGRDWEHQGRLGLTVLNGAGTAGGTLRLWANHGGHDGINYLSPNIAQFHGFVWWQPMRQLRLTVGRDPWAMHGVADLVGWGFNANNSESWFLDWGDAGGAHYGSTSLEGRVSDQRGAGAFSRNAGFYPGFGDTGITALVRPISDMPELSFVFALPWMFGSDDQAPASSSGHWVEGLMRAHAGVRYAIPHVGTLALTWIGGPGDAGWLPGGGQIPVGDFNTTGSVRPHSSKFFLSMNVTALMARGMQFNVGLAYMVPYTHLGVTAEDDVTTHFPVEVGLGFLFNRGAIRVPVRAAATFAGSEGGVNAPWRIGVNINPRYNLGFMFAHLAAGIQFLGSSDVLVGGIEPGDTSFGWHVTPHVSRELAGPTRIFAGVHIESNGVGNLSDNLIWRVPVGIHLEW